MTESVKEASGEPVVITRSEIIGVGIFIVIIALVMLVVAHFSSNYPKDLTEAFQDFSEKQNSENLAKIENIINEIREDRQTSSLFSFQNLRAGEFTEEEMDAIKPWFSLLIESGLFDVFYRIYKTSPYGPGIFISFVGDQNFDFLNQVYRGNNAGLHFLIARWLKKQTKMQSVYRRLEKAALLNEDYVDEIRGFLRHYGCTDAYLIWGELGKSDYSHIAPEGDDYETLPVNREVREKMPELRKALRVSGVAPQLSPKCPILLYQ